MNLWRETPVYELDVIGRKIGKSVYAKMECFQQSGSFKARGIGLLCKEAVEAGATHLISSSGGNAGYTAAYSGRKLNTKTTVLVPQTAPVYVREKIASEGAEVIVYGSVWDETNEYALKLAEQPGAVYIPPFDHPALWRGYATMIDEVTRQCPKPDAVILSVGGGGLMCGVIEGLRKNNYGDVPVIAVETTGSASLYTSMLEGKSITLDKIETIASSLAPKRLADSAFEWTKHHKIIPVVVSDSSCANACIRFADDYRVFVEPACGASLSVVYENHDILKDFTNILVIVCGGVATNTEKMCQWSSEYKVG